MPATRNVAQQLRAGVGMALVRTCSVNAISPTFSFPKKEIQLPSVVMNGSLVWHLMRELAGGNPLPIL